MQPTYRLAIAWQLARSAARVDGQLVEFGTFRGGTACVLLRATDSIAPQKRLYLYDTFEGIPDDGLTGHERALGMTGRWSGTSVEFVREALESQAPRAEFRAGFIPASLEQAGPDRISFMHVDLNASAATVHALEWAYPRWSPGGICLLDDYLWHGYEDQRQCLESFFGQKQRQIVGLPTGQGFVVNQ
jgi:O-methyltransferase